MSFTSKEVMRSIREFQHAVEDVLEASHITYQEKVNYLMNLIENDKVLNNIVGPYLQLKIDRDAIEYPHGMRYRMRPKLPINKDERIAYVLQVLYDSYKGKYKMEAYAFEIYRQTRIVENLYRWNDEFFMPCVRELFTKLNDLIEDQVKDNNEIHPSSLQIINYGSITAHAGANIALGHQIVQSITQRDVVKDIVEEALQQNAISQDNKELLEKLCNNLKEELDKENADQNKLKEFAKALYNMGKEALLKITIDVFKDQRWQQAVLNQLLGG